MKNKKEALTVSRFITEVLVDQLDIPFKNIVNDTTFSSWTGSKRPDLLISEIPYHLETNNDHEYIANLVAYAEAKDGSVVGSNDWKDAYDQGMLKAPKLSLPYFIVTNCKISYFYNTESGQELTLNGNPIREIQGLDVLRLIKKRLLGNPNLTNITTSVDTQAAISEAVFNKKLWELANIYRGLDFKNISEKIDFTIGFISLKVFEEKAEIDHQKNASKIYWSNLESYRELPESFVNNLAGYISSLEDETDFKEFKDLMEVVRIKVSARDDRGRHHISPATTIEIFDVIQSAGQLHNSGFDLFGAVYEMFASTKEKSDFGEFFTRRHYTHVFSKLMLKDEKFFDTSSAFRVLDPACGTGGFLTEAFKVLQSNYESSGTLTSEAVKSLKSSTFYGFDIKEENVSRTKLNMFLVGDGHTHIQKKDSLLDELGEGSYDYVITNPPYGAGSVRAETSAMSTNRYEIAFLARIFKLLKPGGNACIIVPDGFFENPTFRKFRVEVLEKCNIKAIVSLPRFAFAPYTKEKTYALFLQRKNSQNTHFQNDDIWMYIIDNDGYANSDKRFPTKLRNYENEWMHDEISSWVDSDGNEHTGILEARWMKYDDAATNGTSWINEKGHTINLRKGGFIPMSRINEGNFYNLLPEYHLRPYEPSFVRMKEFNEQLDELIADLAGAI